MAINSLPPHPSVQVKATRVVGQRLGDRFQDLVSKIVPIGIVEWFKMVDIHTQQAKRQVIATLSSKQLFSSR